MGGIPSHKIFHLHPHLTHSIRNTPILERGAHKPSPTESLAPFHQDPAQRIIALHLQGPPYYLVLRVGALLELLKDSEGTEIGWDKWKNHVVLPSLYPGGPASRGVQVSGSRLFHIYLAGYTPCISVFDFSLHGRAKYSSKQTDLALGAINHLSSTGVGVRSPLGFFFGSGGGRESIILSLVGTAVLCSLKRA